MGRQLVFRNILHAQVPAAVERSAELDAVADAVAGADGLLGGVDRYGDTMFNPFQLTRVVAELDAIAADHPHLAQAAQALTRMAERVIRMRGYFWIIGD